jgi:hypothetical protein
MHDEVIGAFANAPKRLVCEVTTMSLCACACVCVRAPSTFLTFETSDPFANKYVMNVIPPEDIPALYIFNFPQSVMTAWRMRELLRGERCKRHLF